MKYGVYMNWEGSLALVEKHPSRKDRVTWVYLFRGELNTDQPLLEFWAHYMENKYEYLGKL